MKSLRFKVVCAFAFTAGLLMAVGGVASAGGGLQKPTVEPAKAAPGEKVTVAGEFCMGPDPEVIVRVGDWKPLTVSDVTGGSWSAEITVPTDAEPGVKTVAATCDHYNRKDEYPKASLEVVAAPAGAKVETDVGSVAAGGEITVTASGFQPDEEISVTLFSDPVKLGVLTADGEGGASDTFTIPVSVAVGVHRLELRGLTSERVASTEITVMEASDAPTDGTDGTGAPAPGPSQEPSGGEPTGNLAFTGSSAFRLALVALVTIGAGAGLLTLRRRRIA